MESNKKELKSIIGDLKALIEAERAGGIEEILLEPRQKVQESFVATLPLTPSHQERGEQEKGHLYPNGHKRFPRRQETKIIAGGGQPQPASKPVPEKSRREPDKVYSVGESRQFQSADFSNRVKLLTELREKTLQCKRCGLYKTRHNVVFGEGNPDTKVLFIGEAPGRDEDLQGKPFIGRAGKVLDRVMQSVGFKREDIYIANILKCRPPGNRNPLPEEVGKCLPFLLSQIELLKPKVVCALGRTSAQTLLNTTIPISALRGKFHPWRGMKFMPTFHPAYILRNPKSESITRMDLEKIKEILVTMDKHE